jgi:hypothetical protein
VTLIKKYYSISEAAEFLGLAVKDLRSLDHLLKKKLLRIRGRRYYQKRDIEYLKQSLSDGCSKVEMHKHYGRQLEFGFNTNSDNSLCHVNKEGNESVCNKIDKLIKLMTDAKQELIEALL